MELWAAIAGAVLSALLPALIFIVLYAWQQPHGMSAAARAAALEDDVAAAAARLARSAARAAAFPACRFGSGNGALVPFELVERILALIDDPATRWRASAVCHCWREAGRGSLAPVASALLLEPGGVRALAATLRAREAVGLELKGPARNVGGEALRALLLGKLRPPFLSSLNIAQVPACCDTYLGERDGECEGEEEAEGDRPDASGAGVALVPRLLTSLDASFTQFGDGCVTTLLPPPSCRGLRELRLSHSALGEFGLGALAQACEALEVLELRFCKGLVACVHLGALLERNARTLRDADFSGLRLSDRHVRLLAERCVALEQLRLFGCAHISPEAAAGLLLLPRLRLLDLGNCAGLASAARGADTAAAQDRERAAALLGRVARIAVEGSTGAGAGEGAGASGGALAAPEDQSPSSRGASPSPGALRELGLFRVGNDALLAAIAASALSTSLRSLDLRGCARLTSGCVPALAKVHGLRVLELQASSLATQTACAQIAQLLPQCELRVARVRASAPAQPQPQP